MCLAALPCSRTRLYLLNRSFSGSKLDAILAEQVICPSCSGDFLPGAGAVCHGCGTHYPLDDGILSLASAGARTALDDIEYDAVYRVDTAASMAFAKSCLDILGARLPRRIDSFLEIGAGTGLFTLGFLQTVPTTRALITDISPTMLKACRRRLLENGIENDVQVRYATWDGADCLKPGSFDFIAGFSVLHHVLDYQRMLSVLRGALRPEGMALVLEPNYRFHVALIDAVSEILATIYDDNPAWSAEDKLNLSDWLFENNTNLRFRGDDNVLAGREDKHMFDGSQLAIVARDAGYGDFELLPFGGRSECYTALKVYSGQLGLSDMARQDLLVRFSRMLPGNFSLLSDEDLAPSTLIILRSGNSPPHPHPAKDYGVLQGEETPAFRYEISISVAATHENWTIALQGWLLGDVDVNYVSIIIAGHRHAFPIQSMRPDVNRALNSARIYPIRRALFSGIAGKEPRTIEAFSTSQTAQLLAETADGRAIALCEVLLEPQPSTYIRKR